MAITQQFPFVVHGRPYGSFAGKTPVVAAITQQMPTGVHGMRYGSFAGKTASAAHVHVIGGFWGATARGMW